MYNIQKRKLDEQKTNENLMELLLAHIHDHRAEIIKDTIECMLYSDDLQGYFGDEGYEILINGLGTQWQVYYSRDYKNPVIVKNIKGRGFPDYDEVIIETVKRLPKGVTKENLEDYVTEEFFNNLFWEDLRFEIENIQSDFPDFVVTGRSGGYWGLDVNIFDAFVLDEKIVGDKINSILDNFEKKLINNELGAPYTYQGYETVIEDFFSEDFTYIYSNVLADIITDTIFKDLKDDYSEILLVSEAIQITFKQLDKIIEATIKYFESTDRWVEEIIANKWWS